VPKQSGGRLRSRLFLVSQRFGDEWYGASGLAGGLPQTSFCFLLKILFFK